MNFHDLGYSKICQAIFYLKVMEVFKAFRGREPSVEALLRHNGLVATEVA